MTTQFIDDQQLVQSYISGNEASLEELITRHKRKVYSYIMMVVREKQLAEDIFQDTFFKVITTLKKGTYNEEGKFLPWVMRISHNLMIDYFRRNKRMPMVRGGEDKDGEDYDIFSLIGNEDQTAEEKLEGWQSRKDVRKLVEQLPEEQRSVLMMRYYYDMSFKEIADTTEVSINTALGRMRYALLNLRRMMLEKGVMVNA